MARMSESDMRDNRYRISLSLIRATSNPILLSQKESNPGPVRGPGLLGRCARGTGTGRDGLPEETVTMQRCEDPPGRPVRRPEARTPIIPSVVGPAWSIIVGMTAAAVPLPCLARRRVLPRRRRRGGARRVINRRGPCGVLRRLRLGRRLNLGLSRRLRGGLGRILALVFVPGSRCCAWCRRPSASRSPAEPVAGHSPAAARSAEFQQPAARPRAWWSRRRRSGR